MKIWQHWQDFWFKPLDLFNVGLFRFILSSTLFVMYLIRITDFQDFYSEQGILPVEKSQLLLPSFLQSSWPFYFQNTEWQYIAHILFLVLLLGMIFGVFSRSLTWLVWVLHLGFLQRNYGIAYGADLFANFWLFYLSFVSHNRYFTVLKTRNQIESSDILSSVFIRLIQIQLCISYAYTGIEKLKGSQWWEGTAVWYVLGMKELLPVDYTFLQNFPLVIGFLTIMTVVFEVYFPAAVWKSPLKYYWLLIGFTFHLSTAIFMSLPFFCLVMTSTYVLFIDPKVVRKAWSMFASYLKIRSAVSSGN